MTAAEIKLTPQAIKEFKNEKNGDVTFEINFSMARDTQRFDLIFALPNDVAKCEVHVAYDTCSVELLELASDTFCFLSGVIKVYYRIYVPPNGGFGRGVVVQAS
uniref:Uncharacterized protein n=1 Tax=Plectus sambesii TaxID=2011161 RepID=A0A914WZ67_9BILA